MFVFRSGSRGNKWCKISSGKCVLVEGAAIVGEVEESTYQHLSELKLMSLRSSCHTQTLSFGDTCHGTVRHLLLVLMWEKENVVEKN